MMKKISLAVCLLLSVAVASDSHLLKKRYPHGEAAFNHNLAEINSEAYDPSQSTFAAWADGNEAGLKKLSQTSIVSKNEAKNKAKVET